MSLFLQSEKSNLVFVVMLALAVFGMAFPAGAQDDVALRDAAVAVDTMNAVDDILVSTEEAEVPVGMEGGDMFSPADSPVISAPTASAPEPDNFFDAESLVPEGEMAKSGPRKVNPALQPGSKLITVRKSYEPDSYTARLVAAERAMKLGLDDSALTILDDLLEENEKDMRVLVDRAVTLQKLGRFEEAMRAYERASEVDPDDLNVKINMLGLLGTKYPSIALRRLLDLRQAHADNVGIVAQIAVVDAQLGDFDGAMKYLGMASGMEPSNPSHIFNMAVISDRAGNTAQAVSYYEKALELDTMHGAGKTIPRGSIYERLAQIR